MKPTSHGRNHLSLTKQIVFFFIGILIAGWAFVSLILSNDCLVGGLPGLSLILFKKFGWDISLSQWCIGLIILIIGHLTLGKKASIVAIAGSLLLPASIYLFSQIPNTAVPCQNPLIPTLFGGFLIGVGLGFIFKANATTGGFSLIARIVNKYLGISISKAVMLIDIIILTSAISIFGFEVAALGIVSVVTMGKGIDLVQTGLGRSKSVTIITDKADELKEVLSQRVDCGITILDAEGGYTGDSKKMLICVIPISKLAKLKRNIHHTDPDAFTIISDAADVIGYGFA